MPRSWSSVGRTAAGRTGSRSASSSFTFVRRQARRVQRVGHVLHHGPAASISCWASTLTLTNQSGLPVLPLDPVREAPARFLQTHRVIGSMAPVSAASEMLKRSG